MILDAKKDNAVNDRVKGGAHLKKNRLLFISFLVLFIYYYSSIFIILRFYAIVCGFVFFFSGNRRKYFCWRLQLYWQLNSLQNDVFQPSRSKTVGEDTFLAAIS